MQSPFLAQKAAEAGKEGGTNREGASCRVAASKGGLQAVTYAQQPEEKARAGGGGGTREERGG